MDQETPINFVASFPINPFENFPRELDLPYDFKFELNVPEEIKQIEKKKYNTLLSLAYTFQLDLTDKKFTNQYMRNPKWIEIEKTIKPEEMEKMFYLFVINEIEEEITSLQQSIKIRKGHLKTMKDAYEKLSKKE